MFDYEDPNILDDNFLLSILKNRESNSNVFRILIKSIIKDIVYIGYQPTNNKYGNKNIF